MFWKVGFLVKQWIRHFLNIFYHEEQLGRTLKLDIGITYGLCSESAMK